MSLFFVTGNTNKLAEAKAILGVEVEQWNIDLPEIQALDSQAVIAAKLAEAKIHQPPGAFFVEDISLAMECLGGLPGPLIKWFMQALGPVGLAQMAEKMGNNRANVTASIGYVNEQGKEKYVSAVISGIIVLPRGKSGFQFDPIFLPDGYEQTFAEMAPEQKNAISHRRLALEQLRELL